MVDSSALVAVLENEPEAAACRLVLGGTTELLIAAPTLTECLIVAAGRGLHPEMGVLVSDLQLTVVPLTEARAYDALRAYLTWGKGFHRAGLNLGDSFSYALAKEHNSPLLFIGNDFALTDVTSALA